MDEKKEESEEHPHNEGNESVFTEIFESEGVDVSSLMNFLRAAGDGSGSGSGNENGNENENENISGLPFPMNPASLLRALEEARSRDGGNGSGSSNGDGKNFQMFMERMHQSLSRNRKSSRANSSQYQELIEGLENPDISTRMVSLTQLNELLSLATEETVPGDAVDTLVPALANVVEAADAQASLLGTRCLNNLIDIIPDAASHAVDEGIIPMLIARLFSVEYIDIAEVSLKALESISQFRADEVLKEGYLSAALSLAGFFSTDYQRVIAGTCANMFGNIPDECIELVFENISGVSDLVQYDDPKVLEHMCVAFQRLVSRFSYNDNDDDDSNDRLEVILSLGVQRRLLSVISDPQSTSSRTWSAAASALIEGATVSDAIAMQLLDSGAGEVIRNIICGTTMSSDTSNSTATSAATASTAPGSGSGTPSHIGTPLSMSMGRTAVKSAQQLRESLELCLVLLPVPILDDNGTGVPMPDSVTMHSTLSSTKNKNKNMNRSESLSKRLDLVQSLTLSMLPSVLDVFSNTANPQIAFVALTCAARMIHLAPANVLAESLRNVQTSSLLANCIESDSLNERSIAQAVLIASILLDKLSSVFEDDFVREGVIRAIVQASEVKVDSEAWIWIRSQCKVIMNKAGSSGSGGSSEVVLALEKITKQLSSDEDEDQDEDQKKKKSALKDLCSLLESAMGVSSHEFLKSGVVEELSHCFAYATSKVDFDEWRNNPDGLELISAFEDLFIKAKPNVGEILVRKLVYALEKVECFKVIICNPDGVTSFSSGMRQLMQPLRLQLKKAAEAPMKDIRPNRAAIDPLTPVGALKEFIAAKVMVSLDEAVGKKKDEKEEKDEKERLKEQTELDEVFANTFIDEGDSEEDEEYDEGEEAYDMQHVPTPSELTTRRDPDEHDKINVRDVSLPSVASKLSREESSNSLGSPSPSPSSSTTTPSKATLDIELVLDGHVLPSDMSIAGALYHHFEQHMKGEDFHIGKNVNNTNPLLTDGLQHLWSSPHVIEYRYRQKDNENESENENENESKILAEEQKQKHRYVTDSPNAGRLSRMHYALTSTSIPNHLYKDAHAILHLLTIIHELNAMNVNVNLSVNAGMQMPIPKEAFLSMKISAKLNRQLNDVLAIGTGAIPSWCFMLVHQHPFVLPFDTRSSFIDSTAFGTSRALMHVQDRHRQDQDDAYDSHSRSHSQPQVRIGRLPRQKVRIQRSRLLESAMKVIRLYSEARSILEIEYDGEVGSGLGPSQEFYTLTSMELRKAGRGLWWTETDSDHAGDTSTILSPPQGLFPLPSTSNTSMFKFIGRFIAKAMKDKRLVDLPFSDAFLKLMIGKPLTIEDLVVGGEAFGRSIMKLSDSAARGDGMIDGVPIEDLGLTFVLHTNNAVELKPDGANIDVTRDNLSEYVDLLVSTIIGAGVKKRVDACREGFNAVVDLKYLEGLSTEELDLLLRGEEEPWSEEYLADSIRLDHGYTANCTEISLLIKVLSGMDSRQRRSFVRFVTGSPRLPPGGLKALSPPLTVVRKVVDSSSSSSSVNDYLPSVMTCMNYLKLPAYSDLEIMRERLLTCINTNQGFHLS